VDGLAYTASLLLARQRTPSSSTVGRGYKGKAVYGLKNRLNALGYAVDLTHDFDEATEKAVRQFQKDHGAQVDGVVGPETFGKLTRAKGKPVNPADVGLDALGQALGSGVKNVTGQSGVRNNGLGGSRSASPATKKSSRSSSTGSTSKTQKGPHGGSVDSRGYETASKQTGPIGSTSKPLTAQQILKQGYDKPGPNAKQPQDNNPEFNKLHPRDKGKFIAKGASGERVEIVQRRLQVAGHKIKKDGQFGPKTEAAVKGFQKAAGLKVVDGIVGPDTTRALRAAARRARATRV
jgi:peptidoglycan hydrolase-like protein with peptidoglycan-binding domain